MPARATASNRQNRVTPLTASGRVTAANRLSVDGVVDDMIFLGSIALDSVQSFSGIVGTYRHLRAYLLSRTDNAAIQLLGVRFNADATANYDNERVTAAGATATATETVAGTSIPAGECAASGAPAGSFASIVIDFPYYALLTNRKGALGQTGLTNADSTGNIRSTTRGGHWRTSNAAITQITFVPAAGSFVSGSVASLYGIL